MLSLVSLVLLAGLAQPSDPPPTTPPASPTPTPTTAPAGPGAPSAVPAGAQPAVAGPYADAKALLVALEKADEGLDRLKALVRYDVTEEELGDRSVREGELFFDRVKGEKPGARPVRRFAVRFDKLRVGTTTRPDERVHVFDGRWYAEKNPKEKKLNRKEVVPPGESFDPLKIGEGPLPIPIGQKHEDILGRYDAELKPVGDGLDPAETALAAFVEGCVQVRLVPRAEFKERDRFTEIRLWYRGKPPEEMTPGSKASERLLPRLARTVGHNGNITLVQLANVQVNEDAKFDAAMMETTAPRDWDVVETPYRKSAPPPAPPPDAAPASPPPPPAAGGPAGGAKPESAPKDGGTTEEKRGEPVKDAPK